jgi:hypothetical protein
MTTTGPTPVASDGSESARHAIGKTATLHRGSAPVVLQIRPPLESLAAHLEGHPALEEVRAGTKSGGIARSPRS